MSYKTILLHLNDPRRAKRLLEAAVPLARAMKAHLIGSSIVPPVIVIPAMDAGGAGVAVEEHRVAYRADMVRLKAELLAASTDLPLPSEWREADAGFDTVAQVLADQARCADLVIASQADSDWMNSTLLEDPVRLVMDSGRPVLLIPNAGKQSLPAKRVTVAWNGRREAARAVFDALPLLKLASEVSVIWINPEQDQPAAGDLPTAEICVALARHGIKCQVTEVHAVGGDAGSELLRQAAVFGSDLLVMGCYGHSRLRELILGGASRHMLARMSLPVLMSH